MKKSWCLGLLCLGAMALPRETAFGQYIYWVDAAFASPSLNRSDPGGGSVVSVPLTTHSLPEGVAVDAVHNAIYFGELAFSQASVNSVPPNLATIAAISTGGSAIRGIAIDAAASKIYWTTSNLVTGATIESANLGGTNRQTVYHFTPGSGPNPRGIAVDGSMLYWADFSSGKISRGDITGGTGPDDLITGLDGPVGVALGGDGNIYWTEANANVIRRRGVISGTVTTLVSGLSTPNYIAVDGASGLMYWTEIGVPRIRRADMNGANVQTLPVAVTHPTGIAATASPLAVQLESFVGFVHEHHVHLIWRTLSEQSNFGFYVQRKHESETSWAELPNSFVAGQGTTSVPHDYTYTDSSATPGNTMYRLKQVDANGAENFSASINANVVTAVPEEEPLAFALKQNYPNPFNPSTTIEYAVPGPGSTQVTLAVYDLLGREVALLVSESKAPGRYQARFDARGLASGSYFYRLTSGSNTETRKLLLLY